VPGQENEHERAAHHIEERDRTEAASLEDRQPSAGDAHANAHDEIQHEQLHADAGEVTQIPLGEELGPPAPSEAKEQDASANYDEAFDQNHEQLSRDDSERDDNDERGDPGYETGKETVQET